jgi:hypothetical protein
MFNIIASFGFEGFQWKIAGIENGEKEVTMSAWKLEERIMKIPFL